MQSTSEQSRPPDVNFISHRNFDISFPPNSRFLNAFLHRQKFSLQSQLLASSQEKSHERRNRHRYRSLDRQTQAALAVATNSIEQFNPVTPTEVTLVHQLIHMQIRFLQMEFLYGEAMRFRVEDIIAKPSTFLPAIMRELDRLPARIPKVKKLMETDPQAGVELATQIIRDFVENMNAKVGIPLPAPPAETQPE